MHISRLDSLKLELQQQAEQLGSKTHQAAVTSNGYAYTQSYNHTAFEVQHGLGYGWTMQSVDSTRLQKVMARPWTADGKTFSERIWMNQPYVCKTRTAFYS
ncbi:hypothetical protein FACS1894217_08170 [Clostridia bacterium]|nr:hypothetical protein FACS1894217_08170 [Clostridia bacterium]